MTARYKLPPSLGSGEHAGQLSDDGDFVLLDVAGWTLAFPLDMVTEIPPPAGLRYDLAEQTPAAFPDFNGRRTFNVEPSANRRSIKLQVVEGEQFGRAAILDLDVAERAAWTVLALIEQLRAGA